MRFKNPLRYECRCISPLIYFYSNKHVLGLNLSGILWNFFLLIQLLFFQFKTEINIYVEVLLEYFVSNNHRVNFYSHFVVMYMKSFLYIDINVLVAIRL